MTSTYSLKLSNEVHTTWHAVLRLEVSHSFSPLKTQLFDDRLDTLDHLSSAETSLLGRQTTFDYTKWPWTWWTKGKCSDFQQWHPTYPMMYFVLLHKKNNIDWKTGSEHVDSKDCLFNIETYLFMLYTSWDSPSNAMIVSHLVFCALHGCSCCKFIESFNLMEILAVLMHLWSHVFKEFTHGDGWLWIKCWLQSNITFNSNMNSYWKYKWYTLIWHFTTQLCPTDRKKEIIILWLLCSVYVCLSVRWFVHA